MRLEDPRRATRRLLLVTLAVLAVYLALGLALAIDGGRQGQPTGLAVVDDPSRYYEEVSHGVVLVFFKSDACPGCRLVEPAVERVAEEGLVRVVVAYVDGMLRRDAARALEFFSQLGVYGTPTLILYRDGVEVARHIGTFPGDQYSGLLSFIERGLSGTGSAEAATRAAQVLAAAGLGLLAALSPCSLPVLVVYSSLERGRGQGLARTFASSLAGVAAASMAVGVLLVGLYVAGAGLPVNPYAAAVGVGASLVIAWGLEFLQGREPVLLARGRLGRLLPVLGLQCSLPFLMAMVSLAGVQPHVVIASSLAFALGYSLPYAAAASLGAHAITRLERIVRSKPLLRAQGLLLIAVGLYVMAENIEALYRL